MIHIECLKECHCDNVDRASCDNVDSASCDNVVCASCENVVCASCDNVVSASCENVDRGTTDSKKSIFKPITPRAFLPGLDRLCRIEFCIFLSEWILVKVKELRRIVDLLKPRFHPVLLRSQQGALT